MCVYILHFKPLEETNLYPYQTLILSSFSPSIYGSLFLLQIYILKAIHMHWHGLLVQSHSQSASMSLCLLNYIIHTASDK